MSNNNGQPSSDSSKLSIILEIKHDIEQYSLKRIQREYGYNSLSNIFIDYKYFANALFKDVELEFIPLYIITNIGIKYFNIKPKEYSHYIKFIKNNQAIFKAIHDELRKKDFANQSNDQKYYINQVKQILLSEASIKRAKPLNLKSLVRSIYDRVYEFPYIPDVNVMYDFYLKHVQPNTYAAHVKPLPKITLPNEQMEQIKRLPWKSKFKVNDFMKRSNWTPLQKEVTRDYLQTDSFSVKKNLKYQLKAVAPRHTLIIDLFYANHFIYLIAINVNTRKAFAIPSPLIKKVRERNKQFNEVSGAYVVPRTGHKEIENVIKMFEELLKQTTIKMVICDNEPSFNSKEFKDYCLDKGIKIHNYIINNVVSDDQNKGEQRPVHSLLAILDRFCRTLRNMAYNIGILNQEIDPFIMSQLLIAYNNSPHTTFRRIFNKPITPNEMDRNKLLEDKLCYQLVRHNFVVRNNNGYDISINSPVRIKNEANTFGKLKHKLIPGIFTVVGKDNNLFICKQGNNIIRVPRYMLKPL